MHLGKAVPNGDEARAVFTDTELWLSNTGGGTTYSYRLDPRATPKRCELRVLPLEVGITWHAIYRLDANRLTIAMPFQQRGKNNPRPTSFDPAKDRTVYEFRRLDDKSQRIDELAELPSELDQAALTELRKALRTAAELLAAGRMEEFAQQFVVPLHPEAAPRATEHAGAPDKAALERARGLAKLFGILATERPTFNAECTRATYDLRLVHVDGLPTANSKLVWAKAGGQWCIDSK
jgi:uncharacterized protein (TIGR03067 family)